MDRFSYVRRVVLNYLGENPSGYIGVSNKELATRVSNLRSAISLMMKGVGASSLGGSRGRVCFHSDLHRFMSAVTGGTGPRGRILVSSALGLDAPGVTGLLCSAERAVQRLSVVNYVQFDERGAYFSHLSFEAAVASAKDAGKDVVCEGTPPLVFSHCVWGALQPTDIVFAIPDLVSFHRRCRDAAFRCSHDLKRQGELLDMARWTFDELLDGVVNEFFSLMYSHSEGCFCHTTVHFVRPLVKSTQSVDPLGFENFGYDW